ncbi:prepilin-type N-terminal cleavage/methylation domain-containing protein [Salinibacterium sp. ZJ450]|uniref:type IV pilus modification PilV family protein n=1 Tax=Salinibacterium sp. ZJ450 TaxID=2708338 RepID=UPI00141F23F9|nr:prepilin-type N-terminal cleavage/methylation domain-containing protein [Salinibacterium sp. ZJ450]
MNENANPDPNPNESGFGLIEIMVSMFLIAMLAVAFLPLLINGLRTTVTNATIATASQLVNEQLDSARDVPANCADISAFDDLPVATTTDDRGTVYRPHRTVATCSTDPTVYPSVVKVTAWVTKDGETNRLAEAVTLIYLETPTP